MIFKEHQHLIRIIELGPCKNKVDDGLPLRTKAFEFLYTCCTVINKDQNVTNSYETLIQTRQMRILRNQKQQQRKTIMMKLEALVQIGTKYILVVFISCAPFYSCEFIIIVALQFLNTEISLPLQLLNIKYFHSVAQILIKYLTLVLVSLLYS